jgi:DNA polymerase I-like protein with 3'-5' exonuclease and polymerase domains
MDKLYSLLVSQKWPEESIQLEHDFADLIARQMERGVGFDLDAAESLSMRLSSELQVAKERVESGFEPLIKHCKSVEDHHRVFHHVNHNGARTGRCTHSVVANIPRVGSNWGQELRALFIPRPGWVMVGADVDGIEARALAHYLVPYDNGALVKRVLNGDIHTENQKMVGLDTRQGAKNSLYAVMYGASGPKVGAMNGLSEEEGWLIRKKILASVPGLEALIEDVKGVYSERGYLIGLDRRRIKPDGSSKALNALIQSAGALVMKKAALILEEKTASLEAHQVIHYHDEYEYECPPELAQDVSCWMVESIVRAGEQLGMECPLGASAATGANWAEVH